MSAPKVVVVDDDVVSREFLASIVTALGYTPICASNGLMAYELLQCNRDTQLVVCDLIMPGMTGQQLVQILRSDQRTRDLPIIMVSSIVKLSEISGILELGASRFIPKPVNRAEVEHYISQLLGNRADTSAGNASASAPRCSSTH